MKHKSMIFCSLPLTWIFAVLLRIWNLRAGYDTEGLPITGHISTICLAGISVLIMLTYLLLSLKLYRGTDETEIIFGQTASISAFAGAVLILAGAISAFLTSSANQILAVILLVLGAGAGLCLGLIALRRMRRQETSRVAELIPILYLLVKLIIDFKGWSIDPIILDYCIRLFAMICILLAFYYLAGYAFKLSTPARTFFFAAAGCFFACAAVTESLLNHSTADLLFYEGGFFWLLPIAFRSVPDHREA